MQEIDDFLGIGNREERDNIENMEVDPDELLRRNRIAAGVERNRQAQQVQNNHAGRNVNANNGADQRVQLNIQQVAGNAGAPGLVNAGGQNDNVDQPPNGLAANANAQLQNYVQLPGLNERHIPGFLQERNQPAAENNVNQVANQQVLLPHIPQGGIAPAAQQLGENVQIVNRNALSNAQAGALQNVRPIHLGNNIGPVFRNRTARRGTNTSNIGRIKKNYNNMASFLWSLAKQGAHVPQRFKDDQDENDSVA